MSPGSKKAARELYKDEDGFPQASLQLKNRKQIPSRPVLVSLQRVGETQFANYPEGSIRLFTDADRATMFATLRGILEHTTLV